MSLQSTLSIIMTQELRCSNLETQDKLHYIPLPGSAGARWGVTHQKVIISRSHLARGECPDSDIISSDCIRVPPEQMQFPRKYIPVSRTGHVCEWLTASGQILQIFPAWARLWARTVRALLGCLVASGAGLGLAKVSGKWVTLHCTLYRHCTGRTALYTTKSHSIFAFAIY